MVVAASRSELLDWINSEFDANYTRIEQCGNGAIFCQIFDSVYPDKIPLNRVHKDATADHQILHNYKLLQMGFNRVGISREVPVDKLMRFKLQDNLEFLQWFCRLCNNVDKHGVGIRSASSLANNSNVSNVPPPSLGTKRSAIRNTSSLGSREAVKSMRTTSGGIVQLGSRKSGDSAAPSTKKLREEINQLRSVVEDKSRTEESLETERNFYFNKLREIEIICQSVEGKAQEGKDLDITVPQLVQHIQDILYSTTDGFQQPEDDLLQQTPEQAGSFKLTPGSTPRLGLTPALNNKENAILDADTF